jgi:hypothetical protein
VAAGVGDFEEVSHVEGNLNIATISDLAPAQTYRFRVSATNGEGSSEYSRQGESYTQTDSYVMVLKSNLENTFTMICYY